MKILLLIMVGYLILKLLSKGKKSIAKDHIHQETQHQSPSQEGQNTIKKQYIEYEEIKE